MTNDLKGRWYVQSWTQEYDDGRVVHPFGEKVEGFIEYGDETLFVLVTRSPRTPFTTGGQWDASDAEKAAAYNEYLSYAGTYSVDGDYDPPRRAGHLSELAGWHAAPQDRPGRPGRPGRADAGRPP